MAIATINDYDFAKRLSSGESSFRDAQPDRSMDTRCAWVDGENSLGGQQDYYYY